MIQNSNVIQVDIKLTDHARQVISGLGIEETFKASCAVLGDSDIDYSLAPNISESRILNAPFNASGIKHKLIYNGVGKDLSGVIKCFVRKVTASGDIQSLYEYSINENFTDGTTVPSLSNGKNWTRVTFDDTKMGYIFYFSTVLDYYVDSNGVNERLSETYTFANTMWNGSSTIPAGWNVTIDNENGSMLLAKQDTTGTPIGLNYRGLITVEGNFSKKIKKVQFNY